MWGFESTQQPILADIDHAGQRTPALLWANRNAFYYGLDRRDGRFLFGKAYAKQTWAKGLDEKGRPIPEPASQPTSKGTLVWPWVGGATNWRPSSYDAERGLVLVPVSEQASIYFVDDTGYEAGLVFRGGAASLSDQPAKTSIKALDARTGDVRWETPLEEGHDVFLSVGGVLTTKTGVAFVGDREELLALDSDTGKILWRVRLGGTLAAAPISYAVDGRQYVAVTAGRALFSFALPAPPR
jgi:alcohol dehydrogenase (cytochrome c)